jgi:enoyl-[acyl-carrier protein] reductase I
MISRTLEWRTEQTLSVGKGATVQQFFALLGDDRLEIDVAPWGEGHLKINGREIAHVDDAKDRRQAFRAIKKIADHYVDTHMTKEAKNASPVLPTAKANCEGKGADCRHCKRIFDCSLCKAFRALGAG